jgi:hypothetical protein
LSRSRWFLSEARLTAFYSDDAKGSAGVAVVEQVVRNVGPVSAGGTSSRA